MLLIYKENIALRVQCGEGAVWIQPVVSEFDNRSLLTTLARNEELLAQFYLSHQDVTDTPAQVADYFRNRGWLVQVPGHEEQQL
ncbi:MAG TPA: hypothetical protein VGE66_01700 [Chitinophagaceae bacterium]